MMDDEVPYQIAAAARMKQAFEILRSYPMIGDFLAYQFVTDLNYSEICDFSRWSSWCQVRERETGSTSASTTWAG